MSELLKFACPAPKCGRKFFTAEKLETHIKLRHPLLSFAPSSKNESNQTNDNKESKANNNTNINENLITKNNFAKQIQKDNIIQENNPEPKQQLKENNEVKNNIAFNHELKKKEKIINENTKINIQKNELNKEKNIKGNANLNNKILNKGNINNIKNKEKNNNKIIKKTIPELKQTKVENEIDKKIEEIEDIIKKTDNNDLNISKNKDEKEQKEKKDKLEKEKRKIILDNLYSKINSLENYFENETLELQKQFELSEIPVFDDITMENEREEKKKYEQEEEENQNNEIIPNNEDNKNELNTKKEEVIKKEEEPQKNNVDEDKIKSNNNEEKNDFEISESQKKYDIGKVIEITDELIFKNNKCENYDEIIELDLSKQNIASFMNNRNIPFEEFTELQKLNLSYNWMTFTYDIRFFTKLKELYINDNKIDDLSFSESLPNLEILNAENNQISFITSLSKCINLKILKLSLNKIEFLNSTLNTIKNLRKLEELTIKDNPFLTQLFAYKQYFIYNYQNILKLDEEEINDIDRDIAGRFVRENNPIYKNTTKRPMSSRPRPNQTNQKISLNLEDENLQKIEENFEEENELENNNIFSQTQSTFRVGNAIISKEMFVPYKGKEKNYNKNQKIKSKENIMSNEENKELKELKEIIKEQKEEIDNLNLELENINQLNKEYEIMIQDYKIKIEQKKINQKRNNSISKISNNDKEKEKNKLLKELEMWKKEYCDLFNRTAKASSSLLTKNLNKPKLLSSNLLKKHYDNKFNKIEDINLNLYKSMPNNEIKQFINRPQTAKVKSTKSTDFDNLYEGIKIMHSRNNFADVLEEKTDDEEEEEELKNNKENIAQVKEEIKIDNDNNYNIVNNTNDEQDDNNDNIILDEEIDEIFRKSCADLEKMREELKFMNENIDKNNKNTNNLNIGGKVKLNPVKIKKDYNSNIIGNKGIIENIKKNK